MNRGIELKSKTTIWFIYNLIPKVNNYFDHGRDYEGKDTYSGDSFRSSNYSREANVPSLQTPEQIDNNTFIPCEYISCFDCSIIIENA